jgi:hypothetical protein
MFKKIIKTLLGQPEGYVSPADQFLARLRRDNPTPSASQKAEITKYKKISNLRDGE